MGSEVALFGSHHFSTGHMVLVVVHVLAAILSLVVAPVVMYVKKGGQVHRTWGKVYFWGMFVANGSAFVLLLYRFNIFLLGVTVLSLYAAITGYRVIYRKRPLDGNGPQLVDWISAVLATLAGASLAIWAIVALTTGYAWGIPLAEGQELPIVFIILPVVFSFIILQNSVTDIRDFLRPAIKDKRWWWYYHMDRMMGSYIGLTTALMVQQVGPRMPESIAWIVWIAPAIIGSTLISRWIASYRRQFDNARPAAGD